jgi:hypothetical protein
MKQTAVKWLVEELTKQNIFMYLFDKEIKQAKEMEKQQIMDAYRFPNTLLDISAEQYYNETFKK